MNQNRLRIAEKTMARSLATRERGSFSQWCRLVELTAILAERIGGLGGVSPATTSALKEKAAKFRDALASYDRSAPPEGSEIGKDLWPEVAPMLLAFRQAAAGPPLDDFARAQRTAQILLGRYVMTTEPTSGTLVSERGAI